MPWRAAAHGVLLTALACSVSVRPAHGQASGCLNPPCAATAFPSTPDDLWLQVGNIHQVKLQFVEALRAFTEAQAGTFGDEAATLSASLTGMRRALDRWDQTIANFESVLIGAGRSAEIHVALATVYLDRHRPDAALEELDAAARFGGDRLDVQTLRALAYGLAGARDRAIGALEAATTLQPANPTLWYQLARHAIEAGRQTDMEAALRGLHAALRPPGVRVVAGTQPPFERASLLREVAGISPIFPIAPYADGYAALRDGDYRAALTRLSRALGRDPLFADQPAHAAIVAGAAFLRDGEIAQALQYLEEAARRFPDEAEVHRALGLAYLVDGRAERSVVPLRTAVLLAPQDVRPRLRLADALVSADRLADAEAILIETIRLFPASDGARHRLGMLYERQARLADAVVVLTEGGDLSPVVGRDRLLQTLGSIYVNQSNLDAAAAAYGRRVEVNPNSAEAHRLLAEIYFLQGRDAEALAEFEIAGFLDAGAGTALVGSGQVHLRARRYEEAVRSFREAMDADASSMGAEGYFALGTALLRLGRTDEGERALDRSREIQAQVMAAGRRDFEADARLRQASSAVDAGDRETALARLAEAVALHPQSARARRMRGRTLVHAGRFEEAIAELTFAQTLEPTSEGHRLLAEASAGAGDAAGRDRQLALADARDRAEKLERLRQMAGLRP